MIISQEWVRDWVKGFWQADAETVTWLKSRPDSVKKLMLKFPPSCLVLAHPSLDLSCPARGQVGIVTSYIEPDEKHPEGMVTVRAMPDFTPFAPYRAQCIPEWLKVVGYHKGLTPKIIQQILESK